MVNTLAGKWTQVRGLVKEHWSALIKDESGRRAGQRERMIGRVRELYGKDRAAAEVEVERLSSRLGMQCVQRASTV